MSPHPETGAVPERPASALRYMPALDGVRGACLLAVMLYHSSFAWLPGSFFSVSTFFSLSGYLITTLLLAEQRKTGTISLRRFWSHRMRRLLPAAILTVAVLVATSSLWMAPAQRDRVAEDALASLLYVVNWRFMSPQYAYDLVFVDPSPFQHFWTLAIEGQFYLLFPLFVGIVLKLGGGPRAVAALCIGLTLLSIAVGWATPLEEAQHRLYYGTDARVGELLMGALLAVILHAAPWLTQGVWRERLRTAGGVALALIAVAWVLAGVSQGWVYRGGFAAYSILSMVVIAAGTLDRGPVVSLLSVGWLRWIGTVSYGAYLFHWPLFMFLTSERTGLPPVPLFFVRLAVTFALAGLSYRFVETPVRRAGVLPAPRFALATTTALLAVAVAAIWTNPGVIIVRGIEAYAAGQMFLSGRRPPAPSGIRFAIFGDSTASSLSAGLTPWLRQQGRSEVGKGYMQLGCGVFVFGQLEKLGQWFTESDKCERMAERWKTAATEQRPDVAVVLIGPWETRNRRRSPRDPAYKLGDPELDEPTKAAMIEAVEALTSAGSSVIWLSSPHVQVPPYKGERLPSDIDASEPARMDRLNEMIAEVARAYPDRVRVIDLAGHVERWPRGELDPTLRSDGVHYSPSGASEIADWLGPEIMRTAEELRAARTEAKAQSKSR